jgi:hypothetical protein
MAAHTEEYLETKYRQESVVRHLRESIFDFVPLETIPEIPEPPPVAHPDALPAFAPTGAPGPPSKPKFLRHSYSIKDKYYLLKKIDEAENYVKSKLEDDQEYFTVSVLELVHRSSGIPISTIKDWIDDKENIRSLYEKDKLARSLKRLGSGRHARFPKAEGIVAEMVREKRRKCKLVSKSFILKTLKAEAEKESLVLFRSTKFGPDMITGFMRRNRFSLRLPSCIRKFNLDEAILICRAFHRELLGVISDSGVTKYARKPLDPECGRFALKYRFNGDEVPYRFGRVKSIVSLTNESLTHVTWPDGWEARLATIYLMMDATGRIPMNVVLIFNGAFKSSGKKRMEEIQKLKNKYPHVTVYFQPKAWMDGMVMSAITREVFKPMLQDLWAADGVDFSESLLQLDNGPGRTDESFLRELKENCHTYLQKSPPLQTGFVQMIDDNCGRIFRDLACDCIESTVEEMSADAVASFTAESKRDLMVKGAEYAYTKWMDSSLSRYRDIGRKAALRTGLAMKLNDGCAGVIPNRFPENYPSTIPTSSGAPVRAYFTPSVVSTQTIRVDVPVNPGIEVQVGVGNLVPDTIVRVELSHQSDTIGIRNDRTSDPRDLRELEEMAAFDGWQNEEDERIFLAEEVDGSESSSDDEESAVDRRKIRKRTRWCLLGCDCERPRGRKCNCERRGDMYCSDQCGCDPLHCRSRPPAEAED